MEVVGRALDVSLDIFFGSRAEQLSGTATQLHGRAFYEFANSHSCTGRRLAHTAARIYTLNLSVFGGGGVPEIRRNNNNTWGGSHYTTPHKHTLKTRFSTTRNGMIQRTRTTLRDDSGHNKRSPEIYGTYV